MFLLTFLIFALAALCFIVCLAVWLWPSSRKATTVPGLDPTDDELGNIPDIKEAGTFHEFLADLHDKFGGIASFYYGKQLCVSVAGLDGFRDTQTLFDRPPAMFEFLEPLVGPKCIQTANGEDGRRRHKIYAKAFSREEFVHLMPEFNKICGDLVTRWESMSPEEHIPVHEYMMALAIRMLTATQFGAFFRDSEENTRKFHKAYEPVMSGMDAILTGELTKEDDPERFKDMEDNIKKMKDTVVEMVKSYRKQRNEGDYERAPFLEALLDSTDDEEIILADAIAMVVGGFHTTGTLLTWALYFLAIYPEEQEKVATEMAKVMGDREDVDHETTKELKYTTQFLEETLRCCQLATMAARVDEDKEMRVCGHLIEPGTPIIQALAVASMDEKYFDDPRRFDPDRFSSEKSGKRPAHAFVPFGVGPRKCLGNRFAFAESYAALVRILRRFRLEPAFEGDDHIGPRFGFVTKPETEIWIKVKRKD